MILQNILLLNAAPAGRLFGLDQQTLIQIGIHLFNACVLAVALRFILYRPVQKFMRGRTDKISGQLSDARDQAANAEKMKAEYEKKLRQIDTERIRIMESARLAAADQSRHILEAAHNEAAEIRRRAHESAAAEKVRLKEETRLHIIEVSSLMAGKLVSRSIDGADQDRLFEEAMAQLEEATWPS